MPSPKHIRIGIITATKGLNPYSRLAGSIKLWKIVKIRPIPNAMKTLNPMVDSLRGPNTKEIPRITKAKVEIGCKSFFQKAR
jgi:hypothetical protein|tara:strand:- start:48 stop:293 length:246 start_codon:yes stop_codon:yes gene_type:complete